MVNWTLVQQHANALMLDAIAAKELSYSPYSNFRVGAALLLDDGTHVQGANVENATYGTSRINSGCAICAERSAIVKMKTTLSLRTQKIHAVAVSSDGSESCTPCGICRQVLREFCMQETVFLMPNKQWQPSATRASVSSLKDLSEDNVLVLDMSTLLPSSFGPSALGHADTSS